MIRAGLTAAIETARSRVHGPVEGEALLEVVMAAKRGPVQPVASPCRASTRLHRRHAPQIQRHADEFPLGLHSVQAAHAELTEAQDVLDPAVWRFGEPFASTISTACFLRLHPCHHLEALGDDV